MRYKWQQDDWKEFRYDSSEIQDLLLESIGQINQYSGSVKSLNSTSKLQSLIELMVSEAIKSSAIEGEIIKENEVASSIRKHFGLKHSKASADLRAEGIAELMIDVYENFLAPISKKQLNTWHATLLKAENNSKISLGAYRKGKEAMQVVSGPIEKRKVHFEAPPAELLNKEMQEFIKWFNNTAPGKKNEIKASPIRAAITHLYFLSIHPYDDGNGRIARALTEKALLQGMPQPALLSLSQEIEANKKQYYDEIETAQRSNDTRAWLQYFLDLTIKSSKRAEQQISFIISKASFYENLKNKLNERQLKIINRMLEEGPAGFAGGINARKYMSLTKCSKATATRDLTDLVALEAIVKREASGRSTSYDLKL